MKLLTIYQFRNLGLVKTFRTLVKGCLKKFPNLELEPARAIIMNINVHRIGFKRTNQCCLIVNTTFSFFSNCVFILISNLILVISPLIVTNGLCMMSIPQGMNYT